MLRAATSGRRSLALLAYGNAFKVSTSEWLATREQGTDAEEEDAATRGASRGAAINPPEEYDGEGAILPAAYARHAADWVAAGAHIVGGCCGCSPKVMEAVVRAVC